DVSPSAGVTYPDASCRCLGLLGHRGRRPVAPEVTVTALDDAEPRDPGGHHRQALELRRGEAEGNLVIAAQELDQEALGPGVEEIDGKEDPSPEAVPQLPEEPGPEAHRQRLVDRRRVDRLVGRHGAVRIRHRPGAVPRLAVVAVPGELAAAAADRV